MVDKKEKKLLEFFGSDIMKKKNLSYREIVSRAGDLIYRSTYAFFERDGVGNVETAAKVALAMECSLNDLYKPLGGEWPTNSTINANDSEAIKGTDPEKIVRALHLLELLESEPDYMRISKATIDASRSKDTMMLAKNLQSILDKIPNTNKEGVEDDG
ncbi:MAG: hypothetical protein FWD05_13480 [Oscillospiraceae bacterium]|nr:hypothetical protein [Oscillospiraceae bacterium]